VATTYQLISSYTVTSGGTSSVTFSSIPQTYTNLIIQGSIKSVRNDSNDWMRININSGTTANVSVNIIGDGNGPSAYGSSSPQEFSIEGGNSNTTNVFGSFTLLFGNYSNTSFSKTLNVETVTEESVSVGYANLFASSFNTTSAISSINLYPQYSSSIAQYSTFYLYGLTNS
jgi:hypothetical protein